MCRAKGRFQGDVSGAFDLSYSNLNFLNVPEGSACGRKVDILEPWFTAGPLIRRHSRFVGWDDPPAPRAQWSCCVLSCGLFRANACICCAPAPSPILVTAGVRGGFGGGPEKCGCLKPEDLHRLNNHKGIAARSFRVSRCQTFAHLICALVPRPSPSCFARWRNLV